jgi:biopolymer transport protein ExbD
VDGDGERICRRAERVLGEWSPRAARGIASGIEKELSRQMVWTVYVEADLNCSFEDVVHAMDRIQGLGAKLVWITPKTREEWKQKSVR